MFRFYFKSFYFGLKKARPWLAVVVVLLVPFSTFAGNTVQPLTDLFGGDMIPVPEDADFGGFVSGIYNLIIYVAGVLAVLLITYGGVLYLTSGPNASQVEEGKKYITNALLGLLLALSAWLILNTINPAMLDFDMEFIDPQYREAEDVDLNGNGEPRYGQTDGFLRSGQSRTDLSLDQQAEAYQEACERTEGCTVINVDVRQEGAGLSYENIAELDYDGNPPSDSELERATTRQRYGTDGAAKVDSMEAYEAERDRLEAAGYFVTDPEEVVDEGFFSDSEYVNFGFKQVE